MLFFQRTTKIFISNPKPSDNSPLTTARANKLARGFLVITRQLL